MDYRPKYNAKTIKPLNKNIENLCDLGLGKDFLDIVQKHDP